MNDKIKVWLSLSVLTDEEKAGYEISWITKSLGTIGTLKDYHTTIS